MVHIGCHRWKPMASLAYAYSKLMRDWLHVSDDDWMLKALGINGPSYFTKLTYNFIIILKL